jgi:hypothetical protein
MTEAERELLLYLANAKLISAKYYGLDVTVEKLSKLIKAVEAEQRQGKFF